MNGIFSKTHSGAGGLLASNKSTNNNKPGQVETAGSLAMWQQGLLMAAMYDSFVTDNPFAVDYSAFGIDNSMAYSGFLSSFANAISTIGGFEGFSNGGFSGFDGGGFASSGGFSGGFSSVC